MSQVRLASGALRGLETEHGLAFLAVPYASAPVGVHRFLPPAPVEPWGGVREAVRVGPAAPQLRLHQADGPVIPEIDATGDDYLHVNVFTPGLSGRRPVLVWVHGGAFLAGSNGSPWYWGAPFARDGVVLVAVNYRLAIEGFLSIADAPQNRGLLDLLAALRWVQSNAADFGGDPDQVTLAGQSAGGAACSTLMSLPAGRGLFRRAVVMSGLELPAATAQAAGVHAEVLAQRAGVAATREGLATVSPSRLFKLHVASQPLAPEGVRGKLRELSSASMGPLQPLLDGELIARPPFEAIAAGAGREVELLVGCTTEELDVGARLLGERVDDSVAAEALVALGLTDAERRALEVPFATSTPAERVGRGLTEARFGKPARRLAALHAAAGGKTHSHRFAWRSPLRDGLMGAAHCLDLPFAFDLLSARGVRECAGDAPPQGLATAFHRAIADFVKSGDPGWSAGETKVFE